MDDQYLGQIMLIAGSFAPKGYLECNGQLLQISQHRDLFKLLDKRYGGDGITTFAVPDLRGRIVFGEWGEVEPGHTVGVESTTLTVNHIPPHTHRAVVSNIGFGVSSTDDQSSSSPIDSYLRLQNTDTYSTTHNASMGKTTVTVNLQDQGSATPVPVPNIMPSLGMIFCISMEGPFPPPD